jgi:diamine N-acetyltransferase
VRICDLYGRTAWEKKEMVQEKISLREITENTLHSILKLEVHDEQKSFVAPNAVSIAQAHFSKHAWFRGIYADDTSVGAGDTPVGFVMMYIDTEKPDYWHFMFVDLNVIVVDDEF